MFIFFIMISITAKKEDEGIKSLANEVLAKVKKKCSHLLSTDCVQFIVCVWLVHV